MLPAVITVVYVLLVRAIAVRVSNNANAGVQRVVTLRLAATTLPIVLLGAVIYVSGILLPESWRWGFAVFAMAFYTLRVTSEVISWRRFYASLDRACNSTDDELMGDRLLEIHKPPVGIRAHQRWVSRILVAAVRAHDLGRTERAVRWLGALDPRRLRYENALVVQQYRAAFALSMGQREVAREVLAAVSSPVGRPDFEEAFAILRTLLRVLDGDHSTELLERVRTVRPKAHPRLADGWVTVEAHILAGRGDMEGARALLKQLKATAGPNSIARIARHGGPASPLAAKIDEESPYR